MADEGLIGRSAKPLVQLAKNRRLSTSMLDLPSKTHESFVNPSWKSPMAAGLMHVAEALGRFWDLPNTRA